MMPTTLPLPLPRPSFLESVPPAVVRIRILGGIRETAASDLEGGTRVLNEWHAIAIAAGHVRCSGLAGSRIEAVEGLGVLGHRVWYETPPGEMALRGPRVLDVRPDGTVRILQWA
jgi:hypothetical protein